MTWHIDANTLDRYVEGDLGDALAMSVETHLLECAKCREVPPTVVDVEQLDRIWAGVRDMVAVPQPRLAERIAIRCGVPGHTARLLSATPSFQLSWVLSVATSLAFAVLASRTVGNGDLPFLVIAPVLPVLGIAIAFGRPIDPVWEISRTTATGAFRLILIRAAAVLIASVGASALAATILPDPAWSATASLLPALTLVSATLALSTRSSSPTAVAAGVCTTWVIGVATAARVTTDSLAAFRANAQIAIGFIGALSIVALLLGRDRFEQRVTFEGGW